MTTVPMTTNAVMKPTIVKRTLRATTKLAILNAHATLATTVTVTCVDVDQ